MPDFSSIAGQGGLGVSTILQAVMGLNQIAQGVRQERDAKKLSAGLVRPIYHVGQGYLDNQALAENRASQGLSDAAMSVLQANNQRSLSSSLDAIVRGGGSPNSIGDIYDRAQSGDINLAQLEEEIRQKNQMNYMRSNEALAGEQEKAWQINEWAPYQDTRQQIAVLRGQGNDNVWKGANTIVGGVNNYATGSQLSGNPVAGGTNEVADNRISSISPTDRSYQPPTSYSYNDPNSPVNQSNFYLDTLRRVYNRPR